MKKYPSIALLEVASVASGIKTVDKMVKSAPISVLKAGTVHNGKYLIMVGGSVASVEEAYSVGMDICSEYLIDSIILPDIHHQLHQAILGEQYNIEEDTVGIVETRTEAALIGGLDKALKGAAVELISVKLADDLGGNAYGILCGTIDEVEAALDIFVENVSHPGNIINREIVPRFHEEVSKHIQSSSLFNKKSPMELDGGEI
ncbi:MAG: BMC domain-containing protein [Calditrichia bacterium]